MYESRFCVSLLRHIFIHFGQKAACFKVFLNRTISIVRLFRSTRRKNRPPSFQKPVPAAE